MSPRRKELLKLGRRGNYVRVVEMSVRGAPMLAVLWKDRETGQRRQQIYGRAKSDRDEAIAYAEGVAESHGKPVAAPPPARLTVEGLWQRYAAAVWPQLRPKSRKLYIYFWKRFESFAGPHRIAEDLTVETMTGLRRALEAEGAAVNTIRRVMGVARMAFGWAETHELIARNRIGKYAYKVAKEDRPESPAEYRLDDMRAILAQFDPTKKSQWRPFVALTLCGTQGARQNSVLHLRWEDVDLEAGRITWQAKWDKVGRQWTQPLRDASREALEVAARFRDPSGWVLWGHSRSRVAQPYTIQSLWSALKDAEERAGIAHLERRGGHGLRRLLAGEVAAQTGDIKLALNAIGDTDVRQAERYLKVRDDRMAETFKAMDTEAANQMRTGETTEC